MTPQAQVTALLCCALGDAVSPLTAAQAKQVLLRLERAGVRDLPRTVSAAELAAGFDAGKIHREDQFFSEEIFRKP